MSLLLQYTLIFASVLILVALGGCFSEHSGVINLGLEGIMIMGALGGALTMRYLGENSSHFVTILAVVLVSAAVGMGYSCLKVNGVFLLLGFRSVRSSVCRSCFRNPVFFQDIAWRIWIRRNNIKWMCWPVHLCCCAMKRWIRPDSWMKISLCMARTSTCRTGWCWVAIKTIISPSVFFIIKEKVPSMAI